MLHELQILTWTVIFGMVQLILATYLTTQQRGLKWNLSARDGNAMPLTGVAARMDRAFKNFIETFGFFAVAVLLVEALHKNSDLSLYGSNLYFVARLLYVPVYAAGIVGLRTLIWFISIIGLSMVIINTLR